MALLVYWIDQAGGLVNEKYIEDILRRELSVDSVNPVGVARLVLCFENDVQWLGKINAWGTIRLPPSQIYGIQKRFVRLLAKHQVELATDVLTERFKATRFYQNRRGKLSDESVVACLKVCPEITVDSRGMCGLARWANRRVNKIVLVLQQIGRPAHYSVIAEQTNALMPQEHRTSVHNIQSHLDRWSDIFVNLGRGRYWLRNHPNNESDTRSQADFGELFGSKLARWQSELDRQQGGAKVDTHTEVDTIRDIGLDFFAD
jgi:hypothetical protein